MKPSFSFSEVCTIISNIDCIKDVKILTDVIMDEKKRYALNELHTIKALVQIRVEKLKNVL